MTLYAALALAAWVMAFVELRRGRAMVRRLADVRLDRAAAPPSVTVVIAARDEERGVGDAMRSVLALEHPGLRVVAVDDRSSDRTGAILDALAAADPRLRVIHVTELPAGWLGKNHALDAGARVADGDWVLFTDADVHLAPDALGRALAHAEAEGLDHLVLGPRTIGGTPLMRTMLSAFALAFALGMRPWRARDASRDEHIGIGAFNLVRRSALVEVDHLRRIALRPDDDVKLGKLLKMTGHRQEFMEADDAVAVEWYDTAGAMVRGLEKNVFPFLDYSVTRSLALVALTFALTLGPLLALPFADGIARLLLSGAVALPLVASAAIAVRMLALPPWFGLGYPVGALLLMVAIVNSMARTLAQGGVRWRGTLYPLAELEANRL